MREVYLLLCFACLCAPTWAQEDAWVVADANKGLPIPARITYEIMGVPSAHSTERATVHPKPVSDSPVHALVLEPAYMLHSEVFMPPLTSVDTLRLTPLGAGAEAALPWVTYLDSSFKLDYHSMRTLEHVKWLLDENPGMELALLGLGTSGEGTACERLGRQRARSVWEYLVTEGIDPLRLSLHGRCRVVPDEALIRIAVEAL